MKWDTQSLARFIEAAQGKRPVDLCLRGCQLVNVLSGQIEKVDLAVQDGLIAGWGRYPAQRTIEADGMYVCPGFIDGHIHIESTLLSPSQFCAAVLPCGTTAVVADPHEIANVLGREGILFFLSATEQLPLDFYFNLPSCVPATPLETSGAHLSGSDLYSLLPHPRLLGLAEMMNFPGVLAGIPQVLDKLVLFQEGVVDGHSPQLDGLALNAYIGTGIASDHECTTLLEAREKLSKGMTIMLREGSQSRDLATLMPVVDDRSWPHCMLVSDDCHPDDLLRRGHMNHIVNRAMGLGMDPIRALTLATWTPAHHFGLRRRGALAPGYRADFSLSPSLAPWNPLRVFKNGTEVAQDGKLTLDPASWQAPRLPASPMKLKRMAEEAIFVPRQDGMLRVIQVREGTLLTGKTLAAPATSTDGVTADVDRDLLKLVVYNRYLPDQRPSVAFVQGIGLKKGAIATTVAHDSHNLIAVGTSDAAIVTVAEAVRKNGGGMAVGSEHGDVEVLPLPIAGLMSDKPLIAVVQKLESLKAKARAWGSPLDNPFMALSFLALPVIPELKLTDLGLVDVSSFSLVPLFESADNS
ncbi:adenine deaminase [Desulfoferrobacter suflitae]|uniref:adenine deaminase n=1 Tax=Desulfoferrobacter suflitae TaxID=2865782 RepID=UPI002164E158|nr:adenine deaminase [Desulfoferrobacter suflitae]MCK8602556.1 adenine deaminase [Desulfoferrobacter suflitae]